MIKTLILLIAHALLVLRINSDQPRYQLLPQLPPAAFIGEAYVCRFQVVGLNLPLFRITGLPQELTSGSSGVISGTPLRVGSFLITVSYSSNSYTQSKQTILRIAQPPTNSSVWDSYSSLYPSFTISANIDTFVFMAGTQVGIIFNASMGTPPYYWTYLRLPLELAGTSGGSLTGFFAMEGYYSFGVTCADSLGKSTDAYFTLNIQPLTFFFTWAPQALRPIADISVQDYYSGTSVQQAWKTQELAVTQLLDAGEAVNKAKVLLSQAQKNMAMCNYTLLLAKQFLEAAERQILDVTAKKAFAEKYFNKTSKDIDSLNQTLDQKRQVYLQAKKNAEDAKNTFSEMQKRYNQLTIQFQNANNQFIQAQNSRSNASYNLQEAEMKVSDSESSMDLTLSARVLAKDQHQRLVTSTAKIDDSVAQSRGKAAAAQLAVSLAATIFANASKVADAASKKFKEANDEVSLLKAKSSKALDEIGQAKFDLQMALNKLYVAMAAKEQIVKTIYLISSQNAPNDNQTSTFAGCNQGAYPSSFGTAKISTVLSNGFILQSSQHLLYGSCTQSSPQPFSSGDLLTFSGYLKSGLVHLLSFSKAII